MELHSRTKSLHRASAKFGLYWSETVEAEDISTYEQGYCIVNQIERFWIDSSLAGRTIQNALSIWSGLDKLTLPQARLVGKVGDKLSEFVKEFDLTYAEIFFILVDVRTADIKFDLQNERKS